MQVLDVSARLVQLILNHGLTPKLRSGLLGDPTKDLFFPRLYSAVRDPSNRSKSRFNKSDKEMFKPMLGLWQSTMHKRFRQTRLLGSGRLDSADRPLAVFMTCYIAMLKHETFHNPDCLWKILAAGRYVGGRQADYKKPGTEDNTTLWDSIRCVPANGELMKDPPSRDDKGWRVKHAVKICDEASFRFPDWSLDETPQAVDKVALGLFELVDTSLLYDARKLNAEDNAEFIRFFELSKNGDDTHRRAKKSCTFFAGGFSSGGDEEVAEEDEEVAEGDEDEAEESEEEADGREEGADGGKEGADGGKEDSTLDAVGEAANSTISNRTRSKDNTKVGKGEEDGKGGGGVDVAAGEDGADMDVDGEDADEDDSAEKRETKPTIVVDATPSVEAFSPKKQARKRKSENAAALPPKLESVKLAQLLAEKPKTVISQSYGAIQAIKALALKSRKTKDDIQRVVHAVSNCKYLLLFLTAKVYEEDLREKKVVEFNDLEKVLRALDIDERFVAEPPAKKRRKTKTKPYIIPEPINDTEEEHMTHLITCLEKNWKSVPLPQKFDGWTGKDALVDELHTDIVAGRCKYFRLWLKVPATTFRDLAFEDWSARDAPTGPMEQAAAYFHEHMAERWSIEIGPVHPDGNCWDVLFYKDASEEGSGASGENAEENVSETLAEGIVGGVDNAGAEGGNDQAKAAPMAVDDHGEVGNG